MRASGSRAQGSEASEAQRQNDARNHQHVVIDLQRKNEELQQRESALRVSWRMLQPDALTGLVVAGTLGAAGHSAAAIEASQHEW